MKNLYIILIIISLLASANFCYAITPNDPYFSNLWYIKSLGLESVWEKTTGSDEVIVAVIDSGVDTKHEDLRQNIWVNRDEISGDGIDNDRNGYVDDVYGWDFYNNDNDPSPSYTANCSNYQGNTVCQPQAVNHGTLIAGIIGAVTNNSLGISGINWKIKIMPVRILEQSGLGDSMSIAAGIDYAANNGASIINLSFVGDQNDTYLRQAIMRAYNKGVLIVAASGNGEDGGMNLNSNPLYPVCLQGDYNQNIVVGVAASDHNGNISEFTNYGDKCVDLLAPGEDFFGTTHYDPNVINLSQWYEGGFSGSSLASPVVAGLAALIKSYKSTLTNLQIRDWLFNTAKMDPVYVGKIQYGLVDPINIFKQIDAGLPTVTTETARSLIVVAPQTGTNINYLNYNSLGVLLGSQKVKPAGFIVSTNQFSGNINQNMGNEKIVAGKAGQRPTVGIYNYLNKLVGIFYAYNKSYLGGVNTIGCDLNNDGISEIVTVPFKGNEPLVKVFDDRGQVVQQFYAYAKTFLGGVNLACGDVNGDGKNEIVTAPKAGGGPHVRIFNSAGFPIGQFFAFDKNYRGGVAVSVIKF